MVYFFSFFFINKHSPDCILEEKEKCYEMMLMLENGGILPKK
jgi:hypothetical protein